MLPLRTLSWLSAIVSGIKCVLSQVASMCIFAKIGFINQLENQRRLSKLNRNLRSLSSKRVPSLQTGGQGQPSSGMACMIYMT